MTSSSFHVVGGGDIRRLIAARRPEVVELMRDMYLSFDQGEVTNPQSVFLRFGDGSPNRIIALPAALSRPAVAGVKWIASFPGNLGKGIPRASAAILLNDPATGLPYACLEGSTISTTRTAASAVLALGALHGGLRIGTLGIIGAGVIAQAFLDVLSDCGGKVERLLVHDVDASRAATFSAEAVPAFSAEAVADPRDVVTGSDVLLLATTASVPHITRADWFDHLPVVLHLSLRDLGADVLARSQNVVDDREHALRENTALQLAAAARPGEVTVAGSIADVLHGRVNRDPAAPAVFSPFGLGMLDIALAKLVFDLAIEEGKGLAVPEFFPFT